MRIGIDKTKTSLTIAFFFHILKFLLCCKFSSINQKKKSSQRGGSGSGKAMDNSAWAPYEITGQGVNSQVGDVISRVLRRNESHS